MPRRSTPLETVLFFVMRLGSHWDAIMSRYGISAVFGGSTRERSRNANQCLLNLNRAAMNLGTGNLMDPRPSSTLCLANLKRLS